jgi:glycosyl transferase family 25
MNQPSLQVQILVISLKRSLDRRKQVEKEMQKISLPWTFLDAVDGSALAVPPVEYKPNKVKRLQGYALTPNEIGCYLSHKKAWKCCVEKNMPTLILEDDFVLSSDFEGILNALLIEVTEWSFVRLQGLYEVPFNLVLEQSEFTLVKNQGDAVGATAYLLKPPVAERLIKHSVDIYEPVDHFLEHHQKHGLEFLAIRPYPVDITRAISTIADRSERAPVKGLQKRIRSIARVIDRVFSKEPWFPR